MAAPAGGDSNPAKDLFYFIGILFGIMFLWYYMGGKDSPGAKGGPFLNPPIGGSSISAQKNSASASKIFIDSTFEATRSEPSREFITLQVASGNSGRINISNWTLENKSKNKQFLGSVVTIPEISRENKLSEILVEPGQKIIVTTGRSPLGFSFRVNKCSGYLNQLQAFNPPLAKNCPPAIDENRIPSFVSNECINLLRGANACQTNFSLLQGMTEDCGRYISENLNYNGCLDNYAESADFFEPEWRIYLNKDSQLWNNEDETIILKDSKGKIVDIVSY